MVNQHFDEIDAEFALTEGGTAKLENGRVTVGQVGTTEKVRAQYGAHSDVERLLESSLYRDLSSLPGTSKPARFFGVRRPHRLFRYEVIAIGHLHLWQTLRVHDVGFLNDS